MTENINLPLQKIKIKIFTYILEAIVNVFAEEHPFVHN